MPKKLHPGTVCWSCRHVFYMQGDEGYSETTPGYDFKLKCGLEHWEFFNCDDRLSDFRRKLQTAETCADFKPHPK